MTLIPISFKNIKFLKVAQHVFSKAYVYKNAMIEQGAPAEGEATRGPVNYYYLYATVKVLRHPHHFLLRRASWILVFSGGTFGVYAIGNENIGERMTYLITLVLIFSTYAIVLSRELPEVPYYTHGDYLIICNTVFVIVVSVLIAIGSPEILDFNEPLENLLGYALFAVWVVCNTLWFLRIWELHKEAPSLSTQGYTEVTDNTRIMVTKDTSLEVQRNGYACNSISVVNSPEWIPTSKSIQDDPKNEAALRENEEEKTSLEVEPDKIQTA